jgi:hypothetical protein
MILHDYLWNIPRTTLRTLWFVGDLHVGNRGFDERDLKAVIKEIDDDEHARWFAMGDLAECININDPRFKLESIAPAFHQHLENLPQVQVNHVCSLLEPIKDKCVGFHAGNHEEKILQHTKSLDPMFDYNTLFPKTSKNLGRGDGGTRIRFKDGTHVDTVKVFTTHGYTGAVTEGAKFNRLKELADSFPNFDLYAMGHVHKLAVDQEPALDLPAKGRLHLVERERTFILSGCYFRTYQEGHASYGEVRNYRATRIGSPYIKIRFAGKRSEMVTTFGMAP